MPPPQEGVAERRPSVLPSITPGTENAQGHNPVSRASERSSRGPAAMPVEDARENGAPVRTLPVREPQPERISGPSFLGLAGGDTAGSSDYLLEEAPRSTWRAWLVLIILVIVGALFYLQWKTNWRANPHELPPPPAAPASPTPTAPQAKAPASDASGVQPADAQQSAGATPAKDGKSTEPKPPESPAASTPPEAPAKAGKTPDEKPNADEDANPPADEEAPNRTTKKPSREPIADRGPEDPSRADPGRDPMLYMAQKYLRGGGATRNCDQAIVYLKAANDKPSAPARSQMGALYATGTCVPLDRVRAYKWFSSAMDLAPNNESLRRERLNLWAQMSSDERQQAVK